MRTLYKFGTALALLGMFTSMTRAERSRDVIVYSLVTDAGKKLAPPTASNPASYLLISGGYREEGEKTVGEKSPPPEKIEQMVRNALTAAHYQEINKNSKELNYIIVYHWGYMNPETDDFGDPDNTGNKIVFNEPMMLALVAGASLDKLDPGFSDYTNIMQAAGQNRYFLIISAYSPAAYKKNREKKLLWRAQMSLDSDGTNQNESMPALVSASVSYLGHETDIPKQIDESLERPSQVIIGTPEVKEFLPAATPEQKNK